MNKQTVMWTALPNGIRYGDDGNPVALKLSVFVSLRLWTDSSSPTLKLFPDARHWPTVGYTPTPGADKGPIQFLVWLRIGIQQLRLMASRLGDPPDAGLWDALFSDSTYVKPYGDAGGGAQGQFTSLENAAIRSYSVQNVQAYLKGQYLSLATGSGDQFPAATSLLAQGAFLQQIATLQVPDKFSPGINEANLGKDYKALLAQNKALVQGNPANAPWDFFVLKQFHTPPAERVALPPPDIDFHRVLSTLQQYPVLLRKLGLVHDLEVLLDDSANAQLKTWLGSNPDADAAVQMVVSWTPQADPNTTTINVPSYGWPGPLRYLWTRCRLGQHTFEALPRASDPELADGMLPFDDPSAYEPVQVDLDGAATKCMDLANNVARARHLHPSDDTPDRYSVPSLRSAGLAVARVNRAMAQHTTFQRAASLNQTHESGQDIVLDREDVTIGYVLDVYDSFSTKWHSLSQRVGSYDFLNGPSSDPTHPGLALTAEDEGWVSAALTSRLDSSSPDFTPDYSMSETLARWLGWSLAAPRPGKTIGLDGLPAPVDNPATTDFKLKVSFKAKHGSLPVLRFGGRYYLRARAVDLAGNRLAPDINPISEGHFVHATRQLTYGRFEPVTPATLVYRHPRTEGDHVERLVIRGEWNTKPDLVAVTERHVAPPKTDVTMAEAHGLLDDPATMRPNPLAYSLLKPPVPPAIQWEGGSIADIGTADPYNPGQYYLDADQLPLPYLPDPFARGAAFYDLPGARGLTRLGFGEGPWPNALPFRLVLKEGGTPALPSGSPASEFPPPVPDPANRELTVYLPKAEVATVKLSSFLNPADVQMMGLYVWLKEAGYDSTVTDAFVKQAAEGAHWMVTPYRTLTLVNAVRQPLITPEWNKQTIKKYLGQTFATIEDEAMYVNRKSTVTVDVVGKWTESLDPLGEPGPIYPPTEAKAFQVQVPLPAPDATDTAQNQLPITGRHEFHDTKYRSVTYSAIATTRFGEYYLERKRGLTLTSDSPSYKFDTDGNGVVESSETVRAADGSASYVRDQDYTMDYAAGEITANASLYGQSIDVSYLVPPITRETVAPWTADVLNSARPAAPKVLYAIPVFGWTKSVNLQATKFTSQRQGNSLRVYLDRPWYSSGEGERLGVVLWAGGGSVPDYMMPYVTQWALDPVYGSSGGLQPTSLAAFPLATASNAGGLSLDELPGQTVAVAGHDVGYDPDRRLWYCDIQMNAGNAYCPFVRLALARYQPKSVPDAHLSRVVLADFMQLTPDRSATIVKNGQTLAVTISGISYSKLKGVAGPSRVELSLEVRRAQLDPTVVGEVAWTAAVGVAPVALTASAQPNKTTLWQGSITLPSTGGPYRLVVKEFELFAVPGAAAQRRLVYADTIEITPPTG